MRTYIILDVWKQKKEIENILNTKDMSEIIKIISTDESDFAFIIFKEEDLM